MRRDPDNGPSPDDPEAQLSHLMRLVAEAAAKASVEVHSEEGSSGDKRILQWLLGVASLLLVAAIVGGIGVYGTLQGVLAIQEQQQRQLDRIENRLDGRSGVTRGEPGVH